MQVKLAAVLSALQQQQLEQHCAQLADEWSQHWFDCAVDDCSVSFNQRLFAQLAELDDCQYSKQGVALHYQPMPTFNALFSLAVPLKLVPQQAADERLVKQFADTVLADLSTRFSATGTLVDVATEQEQWQLALTLIINCQPVVVRLSAVRVQHLLKQYAEPKLATIKPALATRQRALQTELVSITPRLGPVSIALKQLLNLQVGSVITLSQPIADPIPFYNNDKVVSLAGYLVNQQGKKALYLTGHKHEQN